MRTFENRDAQKRNALVFFGSASENVCIPYFLKRWMFFMENITKVPYFTSKDVSFLKGAYKAHIRTYYFKNQVNIPRKVLLYMQRDLFKNLIVRKIFRQMRDFSAILQFFLILLSTAIDLLNNSFFFAPNFYSHKMTLCESLFNQESREAFMIFCLESINKQTNVLIDPPTQAILAQILYTFFQNLVCNKRFFEKTVELGSNPNNIYDMRHMMPSERWHMRIRIADLIKEGKSQREIESYLHVNRSTVGNVAKILNENSTLNTSELQSKLRENKRGPTPDPYKKISKEAYEALVKVLVEETPDRYGIDSPTWTGEAVRQYLKIKHSTDVTIRYLYYFLARMHVTSKFAKRTNFKQNKKAREAYLRRHKDICRRALAEGRILVYADETSTLRGHRKKGFAPIGMRTHLSYNETLQHTHESNLTFMSPDGFIQCFTIVGAFTSAKFIEKLNLLRGHNENKKFLIVADNCSVHKSKEVNEWLRKLNENGDDSIVFEWLPPYCPELNPVEYFNNEYKQYLASRNSRTPAEVSQHTDDFLWKIRDMEDEERTEYIQSFFMGEGCAYVMLDYRTVLEEFHNQKAS